MQKPEIREMKLSELKGAEYNPRRISKDAMAGLESSIDRFGLVQPIIWNKRTKRVVGGHQRLKVLQKKGEKQAQVVVVDLPENEEKALNVTLNNPHISGDFTNNLQELIDSLKSSLPDAFKDLRLDQLIGDLNVHKGNTDPDDVPPVPKKPVTKLNDLWLLDDHKLLCADSSEEEAFKFLMGQEECHLVFTDPPYGVDYGAKNRLLNSFQKSGRNLKDIANDMITKDELYMMLVSAFKLVRQFSRDDASLYVTSPQGGELCLMMMMMMMKSGLAVKHIIIWNKNAQTFSLGRLDYEYKHEPILYTWKKTHRFYGKGQFKNSVWDIPKPQKSDIHPTMKPIALVENAIFNSSKRGDIVLDPFCGSGTTIISSEMTERKCHAIEIDPAYCDVIIDRWQQFTGQKAKRA